jgi:hypothetical protein
MRFSITHTFCKNPTADIFTQRLEGEGEFTTADIDRLSGELSRSSVVASIDSAIREMIQYGHYRLTGIDVFMSGNKV